MEEWNGMNGIRKKILEEWNGIRKKLLVWNGIWNGRFLVWNGRNFAVWNMEKSSSILFHSMICSWATQLQRNVAVVASRGRNCFRFDRPRNRTPDLPHR